MKRNDASYICKQLYRYITRALTGQCGGALGYPWWRSKPALSAAWLASTLPARSPNALSNCWCWLLTANRLTCTGIGTTSLLLFCWLLPFGWWGLVPKPAFTLFHFARRFWNQIFTCTSLRRRADAIWLLSVRDRYFFAWNSRSSSRSCSLVKAVRRRRTFVQPDASLEPSELCIWPISSSVSDSEINVKCFTNWIVDLKYFLSWI